MADSKFFALYERLPVVLQNAACSLAGIKMRRQRYNGVFLQALQFLRQSQWWSQDEQRRYQDEQVRRLVEHAYHNVPYYHDLLRQHGLQPREIDGVADLPKLPLLDKMTIRRRSPNLFARDWPRERRVVAHTGGTTGTATEIWADLDTSPWVWAMAWRCRERFGVRHDDDFVVFAGRSVVPLSTLEPPIWRRNLPMRQTYVSVHHMTLQNMRPLVEYLQSRRVTYYAGYPSALYALASYMLEHGLRLPHPPRIVGTTSETVLPYQREAIERALQSVVVDQYGATEQCVWISECEAHRYHVDFEFGAVEFVPIPGLPDQHRRIICTGFKNPLMPLIRYDIGDVAVVSDEPCRCGRQSPTIESIDGRIESYIATPDGRVLGRLDFLFKESVGIAEAQLVQETEKRVTINVVRDASFRADEEVRLRKLLRHYLGGVIELDIVYVEQIPREANGKLRQIVSRVAKRSS